MRKGILEQIKLPSVIKTVYKETISICSCSQFQKENICCHSVVADVSQKKIEIPNYAKDIQLEPNRKKGRKSLAKKALERQ